MQAGKARAGRVSSAGPGLPSGRGPAPHGPGEQRGALRPLPWVCRATLRSGVSAQRVAAATTLLSGAASFRSRLTNGTWSLSVRIVQHIWLS